MKDEKELKNFLVYSYYGIVMESINDESEHQKNNPDSFNDYCMKMVIIKAYGDATNEGAYNTLFKKEFPDIDKLKESSKEATKQSAKLLLEELKKLKNQNNFDAWHEELCNNIIDKYCEVKKDEQAFFTYGNAQKWINMTIKYLWLFGMLPNCIKEKDLHIPVDSFIIDALWKDHNVKFPVKENKSRERDYSQPSSYVKPWSQWNYEDYQSFHKSIKGTKYTLTWENNEWIKMSAARKRKNMKDRYTGFFGE